MSRSGNETKPREGAIGLETLRTLLDLHPDFCDRILRQLLIAIHQTGLGSVDDLYREARRRAVGRPMEMDDNPNRPGLQDASRTEQEILNQLVAETAASVLSRVQVEDLVNLVLKRERARSLEEIAALGNVSTSVVLKALEDFTDLPVGGIVLSPEEIIGTRVALIRRFITDQLHLIGVAKNFLKVRDMEPILKAMVTSRSGHGRIGGKSAGLIIARSILHTPQKDDPIDFAGQIQTPTSFFLSSDVHQDFVQYNRLVEFRNQKYKSIEEIRKELPMIVRVFRDSLFPPDVVGRLREIIEEVGETPLIVRSSSHLEDSLGMAFSGKYRSIFLGNQGSPVDRLKALLGAISEIYASVFGPDPISYRRSHDMLDYDEMMGVLIQKVVGQQHGVYFFPFAAGVAFSYNEHRWTQRIRREDGLVRLVMGLGTRAVDRTGDDYPRMIPLGMPTIRPESGAQEILRYSQRFMDVIHLGANRFETVPIREAFGEAPYAGLEQAVAHVKGDEVSLSPGRMDTLPEGPFAVTFDRFIKEGPFISTVRAVLKKLEASYGTPVDIEFVLDQGAFYLLQCRPLARRADQGRIAIPRDVPKERILFTARRNLPSARVEAVEVIVYVDPTRYDRLTSIEEKSRVGACVSRLNETLKDRTFILMGPGRWGSSNIHLGVRVSYADITHTRLLVEIAREKEGYTPEVSYGTHFFQDLVESGICPLPLYPDDPGVVFNERFLSGSASSLASLAPDYADVGEVVRVLDLPSITGGLVLDVLLDGDSEEGIGFLRPA